MYYLSRLSFFDLIIRVTISNRNSYPYYQDKKKLVFISFLKPKIITIYFSLYQEKIKLKQKQLNLIKNLKQLIHLMVFHQKN